MVKNPPADAGRNIGDEGSIPGLVRSPWRRAWQPTPVFRPGESHGQRSLVTWTQAVGSQRIGQEMVGWHHRLSGHELE